jgi:hypothetical protein
MSYDATMVRVTLIALSLLIGLAACEGFFVRGGGSEHGLDRIKIGVPL